MGRDLKNPSSFVPLAALRRDSNVDAKDEVVCVETSDKEGSDDDDDDDDDDDIPSCPFTPERLKKLEDTDDEKFSGEKAEENRMSMQPEKLPDEKTDDKVPDCPFTPEATFRDEEAFADSKREDEEDLKISDEEAPSSEEHFSQSEIQQTMAEVQSHLDAAAPDSNFHKQRKMMKRPAGATHGPRKKPKKEEDEAESEEMEDEKDQQNDESEEMEDGKEEQKDDLFTLDEEPAEAAGRTAKVVKKTECGRTFYQVKDCLGASLGCVSVSAFGTDLQAAEVANGLQVMYMQGYSKDQLLKCKKMKLEALTQAN